jgi:hypothetical protein
LREASPLQIIVFRLSPDGGLRVIDREGSTEAVDFA